MVGSFDASSGNPEEEEFIQLQFHFGRTQQLKRLSGRKPCKMQAPCLLRPACVAQFRKMQSKIGHRIIRREGKIGNQTSQVSPPIRSLNEKLHQRDRIRAVEETTRRIEVRKF